MSLQDLHHDMSLSSGEMLEYLVKYINQSVYASGNHAWPMVIDSGQLQETIRHLLWHFVGVAGGYQPGAFTTHLIDAISVADRANTAKLIMVYPAHVILFNHVQKYGAWILQRAVGEV
jgi:hypothetical protein